MEPCVAAILLAANVVLSIAHMAVLNRLSHTMVKNNKATNYTTIRSTYTVQPNYNLTNVRYPACFSVEEQIIMRGSTCSHDSQNTHDFYTGLFNTWAIYCSLLGMLAINGYLPHTTYAD